MPFVVVGNCSGFADISTLMKCVYRVITASKGLIKMETLGSTATQRLRFASTVWAMERRSSVPGATYVSLFRAYQEVYPCMACIRMRSIAARTGAIVTAGGVLLYCSSW